jgi:predicted DsbA family dithiol-disulfide isomerase
LIAFQKTAFDTRRCVKTLINGSYMSADPIRIDFVSDIACPWCAVGLGAMEQALQNLGDEVTVDLHFQPFELNPQMPPGGQEVIEHLTQKYGISAQEALRNQQQIRERAAEVGFIFHPEGRKRVYNTFNAHLLLSWAENLGIPGAQHRLKRELLATYFTLAVDLDDTNNLLAAVDRAGLDRRGATQALRDQTLAAEVRQQLRSFSDMGISAVPSVIFNRKYLIQGAQPVAAFESVLRKCAEESATQSTD